MILPFTNASAPNTVFEDVMQTLHILTQVFGQTNLMVPIPYIRNHGNFLIKKGVGVKIEPTVTNGKNEYSCYHYTAEETFSLTISSCITQFDRINTAFSYL